MNPQIQDLKDKIWAEEYWTNPNTDRLLPAQLNKFAELIVRECAQRIDYWESRQGEHADDLLKHFGVEE